MRNEKARYVNPFLAPLLLTVLLAIAPAGAEAVYEQQFTLRPGWNAIYLEVQPEPAAIEEVFAGIPLASVWSYNARLGPVTTLPDPSEGSLGATGWFGYFPPSRAEHVLSDLFGLRANRAYLVKLDGSTPTLLTVRGRPRLQTARWVPDSFNLVGFAVDPGNPPSFGTWFEPSAAHDGQPIYRLDPSGSWQLVNPLFEPIRSGEAYWVYTDGPSGYDGPLEVSLETGGDRIEYGAARELARLRLVNRLEINTEIELQPLTSPIATPVVPLRYETIDADDGARRWSAVPAPLSVAAPAGTSLLLTLAPERAGFSSDRVEQVFALDNGLGARRLVFVGANTAQSQTLDSYQSDPGSTPPPGGTIDARAGLWVGTASVRAVNEVRCDVERDDRCVGGDADGGGCDPEAPACPGGDCVRRVIGSCVGGTNDGDECDPSVGDPDCPGGSCSSCAYVDATATTPTRSSFDLRLLVHVDDGGQARLIKDVVQMARPAVTAPSAEDPEYDEVVDRGELVLLTDESLISSFEGVAMRDGVPVGLRISTLAYDFDDSSCSTVPPTPTPVACGYDVTADAMLLLGSFGDAGTLEADFALGRDFATNPFFHRYHPDHDNLDAQFTPLPDPDPSRPHEIEAPEILRHLEMEFRSAFAGSCSVAVATPCIRDADCPDPENGESCVDALLDGISEPPGWGADVVGGIYRETVYGLRAQPTLASGTFLLERIATTPSLNPQP